jgi:hypothetical protein
MVMTETGTDYRYEHSKLRKEFIEMAERAANDIDSLRAQIRDIAPRAEAFNALQQVLDLMPKRSVGSAEDLAWMLRRRAEALKAEK